MRFSAIISPLLASLVAATQLRILVPSSRHIPNPSTLPSSTTAILSALGHNYVAPLSLANTFSFRNVSSGSYLLTVACLNNEFTPLRIDVKGDNIDAWGTFRGSEWDNKGEVMQIGEGNVVEVRAVGVKEYYFARAGFSPLSMLKNPMILIAMVSMAAVFGMPYLLENMDPEMRADYEESQKAGITGMLTGKSGPDAGGNPVQNFDAAAWLAGSGKKDKK